MRETAHDQASGLRRLFAREALQILGIRGAGDSDATAVSLDLAATLVALGHHPLIVDLEGASAATALGLEPRYELAHVLSGDKTMREVLLMSPDGIAVLPAMRGLERAAERGSWKRTLTGLLRQSPQPFSVWLINGVAGPMAQTESSLLVIAPTRSAITGAYAQIKSLARDHGQRDFRVVVDRAVSESAALSVYTNIAETSRRFLAAHLDYCGHLPEDDWIGPSRRAAGRTRITGAQTPRAHAFSRLAAAVFSPMAPTPQLAAHNPR